MNPDGPDPLNVQIAAVLRAEIRAGELGPGDKLLSTRKLADQFGVSSMTAIEAIKLLREEGLVFTTQRGSFVVDPSSEATSVESAEYVEIKGILTSLDQQVRSLADRLADMEAVVQRIESSARSAK